MILQEPLFDLDDDEYAVVLPAMIVYIILTVFGLIIVSIFIATLVEARAIVKEYPFFIIVWQVTFSNALNLLAQATCMIPCIFIDARDGELSLWYTYGAHIIDLTDYSVTFFFFLMAINRFAVFVMPCISKAFTKSTTYYSVIVTWLFVLMIFGAKINLATVEIKDTTWGFFDFFIHSDVATTIIVLIGYIVPIIILLIYITIYAYIQKERSTLALRQKTHTDKNDVALLWQGFVIAIAFIIYLTLEYEQPGRISKSLSYLGPATSNSVPERDKVSVTSCRTIFIKSARTASLPRVMKLLTCLAPFDILVLRSFTFFRTINTIAPRVDAVASIQWFLNILKGMASVANHMLNPILFLTTNKTIRGSFQKLKKCQTRSWRQSESVLIFESRNSRIGTT